MVAYTSGSWDSQTLQLLMSNPDVTSSLRGAAGVCVEAAFKLVGVLVLCNFSKIVLLPGLHHRIMLAGCAGEPQPIPLHWQVLCDNIPGKLDCNANGHLKLFQLLNC